MTRFALLLTVLLLASGDALGQRSSGKSYSSGGGKSYSSGSRGSSSGSKSYSSGSRGSSSSGSKGKSYSSGSGSRSSSSSSSSRPSSSFGGSSSRPSRPSSSSYDAAAGTAAKRAESKSIFERRSTPNVPGVPNRESHASPSGRSYSERNVDPRPAPPVFRPGPAPRPSYTGPSGQSRPINPTDRRVEDLRREMDEDRWYSRNQRRDRVFSNVRSPGGTVIHYQDPYSNLFWWWLLSRSLEDRAYWAYHHRHTMDPLRYRDLVERDRALEARIRELEAKQIPRDPTVAPSGIDRDLMYTDEYVAAAVNPTLPPDDEEGTYYPAGRSAGGAFFRSCFTFLLIVGIIAFVIWFVFIKRWGATIKSPRRRKA